MTKNYVSLVVALCAFVLPFTVSAQTKPGPKPGSGCDKYIAENQSLKKKIEDLKQDTVFLKNKLAFFNTITGDHEYSVTSFSSDFDFKVVSCKGDRAAQTVKVEFVVHHKRVNQKMRISASSYVKAYDELGHAFGYKEVSLGNVTNSEAIYGVVVPTDIDVRGYLLFRGVLGGTEKFKLIEIPAESGDQDGGGNEVEGKFTIKDIKINW